MRFNVFAPAMLALDQPTRARTQGQPIFLQAHVADIPYMNMEGTGI